MQDDDELGWPPRWYFDIDWNCPVWTENKLKEYADKMKKEPMIVSDYQEYVDKLKSGEIKKGDTIGMGGMNFKVDESDRVSNNVDHPSHYNQGSIECIDALKECMTREEFSGFCRGNAMKYLWRHKDKYQVEDLQKAKVYLDWLIKNESTWLI